MTLASTDSKRIYPGNGSQVEFPIVFAFLANADITATHTDASSTETTWVENVHYTLTGAGSDRGVMIDQGLAEELDRAVKVPVEEEGASTLPRKADRKNRMAGWDANGKWTVLSPTDVSTNEGHGNGRHHHADPRRPVRRCRQRQGLRCHR